MNKYLYATFIAVFLTATAFIFYHSKTKQDELPPLKARVGEMVRSKEWLQALASSESIFKAIKADPKDLKLKLKLVQLYIQEGRITGDHAYYDPAALKLLEEILTKDPVNFEGLCFKGMVQLSQHHFTEALETVKKAQAVSEY